MNNEARGPTGPKEISCPQRLEVAFQDMLARFFETKSVGFLETARSQVTFLEVPQGAVLIEEGCLSDDIYFVLGGRLRAVRAVRGGVHMLGEIGRGEVIGELAMLLGEPRSASILAVRDSVVAMLPRLAFEAALEEEPRLALTVARGAVRRYQLAEKMRQPARKPTTVCFLALSPQVDAMEFARQIADLRVERGEVVPLIRHEDIPADVEPPSTDGPCPHRLADWLIRLEAASDCVFLIAEDSASAWTRHCLRHADEVLLLVDGHALPGISRLEHELFDGDGPAPSIFQTLVLFHDPTTVMPKGTARWLDRRPVHRHFHVRRGHVPDLRRMARTLSGTAIGYVLAGGGARAFVHFGVINALSEFGIEPDFLGGTSMGATASAWRAMDLKGPDFVSAGRKVYLNKPTSDINFFPVMSLVRGRKVRRITEQAIEDAAGSQIDIEDMWLPYFCIATNMSAAEQAVLKRGPLARSLLASFSIPGALPPVLIDGHLMVDGGTFNNFPVDIMESLGVGRIIGVVVDEEEYPKLDLQELPDQATLLLDSLRPANRRQYNLPFLPEILLTATISSSINRQRQASNRVDLLFKPHVSRIGPLQWEKYDALIEEAHADTLKVLQATNPEKLNEFR
jgi:NTE family protein